jgi:hypothetical protein
LRASALLQAGLRGGVGQAGQLLRARCFLAPALRPAGWRFRWRGSARPARLQAALRERGLLRLALQAALLLAALGSLRSASITRSSSWAWRSWLSASCMSSSSKRASAVTRRSCRSLQLGLHLGQVGAICSLRARVCSASWVRRSVSTCSSWARLWFRRFAAQLPPGAASVGIGGLARTRAERASRNQRLGAQLLVQVLDLLGAGQQAGLLGVLRVKAHAVGGDGMAAGHIDHFAGLQLARAGQRLFQAGAV